MKFTLVRSSEIYLDARAYLMMTILIFLTVTNSRPNISQIQKSCVWMYFSSCKSVLNMKQILLTKHVILALCLDFPDNLNMSLNPLQINWTLILTQLISETHTLLLFLVNLMHKQNDDIH